MNFVQAGQGLGTPFRPYDFLDSFALAFKPVRVQRNEGAVKSEAECTIVVFDTEESEPRVLDHVVVTQGDIFWSLAHAHLNDAVLIGYLSQGEPTKYGTKPWVLRDLAPEDAQRIAEVCEGVLA